MGIWDYVQNSDLAYHARNTYDSFAGVFSSLDLRNRLGGLASGVRNFSCDLADGLDDLVDFYKDPKNLHKTTVKTIPVNVGIWAASTAIAGPGGFAMAYALTSAGVTTTSFLAAKANYDREQGDEFTNSFFNELSDLGRSIKNALDPY